MYSVEMEVLIFNFVNVTEPPLLVWSSFSFYCFLICFVVLFRFKVRSCLSFHLDCTSYNNIKDNSNIMVFLHSPDWSEISKEEFEMLKLFLPNIYLEGLEKGFIRYSNLKITGLTLLSFHFL